MKPIHILNIENTLKLSLRGIKLIEASAGTGKTYAISNLYLRFVCEGYTVGQVLVVTFTIAATEELRGRIRLRLHQAMQQLQGHQQDDIFFQQWASGITDTASTISQLQAALHHMDDAAIYTINGFCQRILSEHALASSQPFNNEMIADDHLLWQQAIQDWWRRHGYPLDPCCMSLFSSALINLDQLVDWQQRLRGSYVEVIPVIKRDMDACYQAWQALQASWQNLCLMWQSRHAALMDILENSPVLGRSGKAYRKDNLARWQSIWDDFFHGDAWWQQPDCLNMLSTSQLETYSQPSKRGKDPDLEDPFFKAVEAWFTEANHISMEYRVAALQDCHCSASAQVLAVKQQQGLMSFHDQLQWLADALTTNPSLADALRKRFPVAMIDEFQDTDALQYTIFHSIYHNANSLIMIGDPKQAIYGFRGGDIFTYIAAADDAQERWTLDHNWRSTATLVNGVNAIFQHQKSSPFLFKGIDFTPVSPANKKAPLLFRAGIKSPPAIAFWQLPPTTKEKNQSAKEAEPIIVASIAHDIALLLVQAAKGEACLGDKPVVAGDIAVLVRTHDEAENVRQALQAVQVAAVLHAKNHVFVSDEAEGLRLLLLAIASPQDETLLHQALASSLFGYDYTAMAAASFDVHQWSRWCEHLQDLHLQWQHRGFMAMFQQLLHQLGIANALAMQPLPERRLTNLLHLGELLQQAAQTRPSMHLLLQWFGEQACANDEDAELRLESDAQRVRIVTIHASKGLEYPIVYIPFAWKCRRVKEGEMVVSYYDSNRKQRMIDIGSDQQDDHRILAEQERLAEDVRLLYVALTRASSYMVIVWGHVGRDQHYTALHSVLHGEGQVSTVNKNEDLDKLCKASKGAVLSLAISMKAIPLLKAPIPPLPTQPCKAQQIIRMPSRQWQTLSFSRLSRDLPHPSFKRIVSDDPILHFRAGRQTGLFLHALLEVIDFQGDIVANSHHFCEQQAVRYGLSPDCATVIAPWMQQVIATPLAKDGCTLSAINPTKRLNELAFDYPINTFNVQHLNRLLNQHAGKTLPPLTAATYQGFMNGVIDLVFEHEGRYYIADYKGNALGNTLNDYCPQALCTAVHQRRYDLQYLIYSIALHRYLTLRLPDYDYETHFGGVYYLFLRGMRVEYGMDYGVHVDRFPLDLLDDAM